MKGEGFRWRQLYRDLLRAAPRAVSGKRQHAKLLATKIRQGFEENKHKQQEESERLYIKGQNTLGILKLARELGSIERMVVRAILFQYIKRSRAEKQPPFFRRQMLPLQKKAYDETFLTYDRVILKIEQDLDIILPQDKCTRSLEWIPPLGNLYKNDPLLFLNKPELKL